jgi:hypothetical protein
MTFASRVVLNNAADARAYLQHNAAELWPYLFAVADGRIGSGPAAAALGLDAGDMALLLSAATEAARELVRRAEFAPA